MKLLNVSVPESIPKIRQRAKLLGPINAETRKNLKKSEGEGLTSRHPSARIQNRQIKPKERQIKEREANQKKFLFSELNQHLDVSIDNDYKVRMLNFEGETDPKSCYFQLCRESTRALIIEAVADFNRNLLKIAIYSFNLCKFL